MIPAAAGAVIISSATTRCCCRYHCHPVSHRRLIVAHFFLVVASWSWCHGPLLDVGAVVSGSVAAWCCCPLVLLCLRLVVDVTVITTLTLQVDCCHNFIVFKYRSFCCMCCCYFSSPSPLPSLSFHHCLYCRHRRHRCLGHHRRCCYCRLVSSASAVLCHCLNLFFLLLLCSYKTFYKPYPRFPL